MSSVLFANSYFYRLDRKQWRTKQPYPPLATILAASIVRNRGHEVSLFDASLRASPLEIVPVLALHRPKFFVLYDDGFNYLSKMCLSDMRDAAFVMIREAKRQKATVIVSSSDASDHAEKYLAAGGDFVIRGEAEETLVELIDCLNNNEDPSNVKGLIWLGEGQTNETLPRSIMKDLDLLPLPAWDLIDIDSYRTIWKRHHGYFSLNIATTRGCPFKCNWCAKPIYGNRYNSRSPGHVVWEIKLLIEKYRPDHFWMCDDIFGLKPGWIEEFTALVREKKLRFRYKIQSRVDLLLEADTIKALSESGAESVWVGAESGSQKILDAMDKGTTVEQIHNATRMLRENGIRVGFFLQVGYPGENQQDIDATSKMLLELMPDEMGISVSYPLPGTRFYDKVKDQLQTKQNWTDSDDLELMFNSTFHRAYYKVLHRYLHSIYREKKGMTTIREAIRRPKTISKNDIKSAAGVIYFGIKSLTLKTRLSFLKRRNQNKEAAPP